MSELSIPYELISEIVTGALKHGDPKTFRSIAATCWHFRVIVLSTPEGRYLTSVAGQGVKDARNEELSWEEKLRQLEEFESAWTDGGQLIVYAQTPMIPSSVSGCDVSGTFVTVPRSNGPGDGRVDFLYLHNPRSPNPPASSNAFVLPFTTEATFLDLSLDLLVLAVRTSNSMSAGRRAGPDGLIFYSPSRETPYAFTPSLYRPFIVKGGVEKRVDFSASGPYFSSAELVETEKKLMRPRIHTWRDDEKPPSITTEGRPTSFTASGVQFMADDSAVWMSVHPSTGQPALEISTGCIQHTALPNDQRPLPARRQHFRLHFPPLAMPKHRVAANISPIPVTAPGAASTTQYEAFEPDGEQLSSFAFAFGPSGSGDPAATAGWDGYGKTIPWQPMPGDVSSDGFVLFFHANKLRRLLKTFAEMPGSGDEDVIRVPWEAWSECAALFPRLADIPFRIAANTMRSVAMFTTSKVVSFDFHPIRVARRSPPSQAALADILSSLAQSDSTLAKRGGPGKCLFAGQTNTSLVLGGLLFAVDVLSVPEGERDLTLAGVLSDAMIFRRSSGEFILCALPIPASS